MTGLPVEARHGSAVVLSSSDHGHDRVGFFRQTRAIESLEGPGSGTATG